jgi:hypothetical protein
LLFCSPCQFPLLLSSTYLETLLAVIGSRPPWSQVTRELSSPFSTPPHPSPLQILSAQVNCAPYYDDFMNPALLVRNSTVTILCTLHMYSTVPAFTLQCAMFKFHFLLEISRYNDCFSLPHYTAARVCSDDNKILYFRSAFQTTHYILYSWPPPVHPRTGIEYTHAFNANAPNYALITVQPTDSLYVVSTVHQEPYM